MEKAYIPVPVKCIEVLPERPALVSDSELKRLIQEDIAEAKRLELMSCCYRTANVLMMDRLLRENYEADLRAALEGCR